MAEKMSTKLKKVRRLLSKPEKWCKNTRSKNRRDIPVVPLDTQAFSFCLSGACDRVSRGEWVVADKLRNEIRAVLPASSIPTWNDAPRRTHKQVLKLLDKCIDRAQKAGR